MKKYTPEQLQQVVLAHKKWLESCGKEGKQANLAGADLREANLEEVQEHDLVKAMGIIVG